MCVSGIACRHDAIEKIDAAVHRLQNVFRGADAHEIPRLVLRHIRLDALDDAVHSLRRLADRQSADGITVEIQLGNILHMGDAQIVEGAALVDAEKHLFWVHRVRQTVQAGKLLLTAVEPAGGSLARRLGIGIGGGVFHTFVKRHCDGRAEV